MSAWLSLRSVRYEFGVYAVVVVQYRGARIGMAGQVLHFFEGHTRVILISQI